MIVEQITSLENFPPPRTRKKAPHARPPTTATTNSHSAKEPHKAPQYYM
jgi:hypothetical protein